MSSKKKEIRKAFRNAVFGRDKYKCTMCGRNPSNLSIKIYSNILEACEDTLDAHHITPREDMPAGGYVKENGITLCKKECHLKAEEFIQGLHCEQKWSPENLYKIIGSNETLARKANKRLYT